jgi:hypothetical protein
MRNLKDRDTEHGIVRDDRGQDQPKDKKRAQQDSRQKRVAVRPEPPPQQQDKPASGLRGRDKQKSALHDTDRPAKLDDGDATPEGLPRPRKSTYDKNAGRADRRRHR